MLSDKPVTKEWAERGPWEKVAAHMGNVVFLQLLPDECVRRLPSDLMASYFAVRSPVPSLKFNSLCLVATMIANERYGVTVNYAYILRGNDRKGKHHVIEQAWHDMMQMPDDEIGAIAAMETMI